MCAICMGCVFLCCRVAVVGNVDAGKSTLLGVLTHGELDNGRGYARQKLFRHKHEQESGRTSSVGSDILGFDGEGKVVNKTDGHGYYPAPNLPSLHTVIFFLTCMPVMIQITTKACLQDGGLSSS